nr:hypothetical protein HmN_000299700 [Hymenolepis microstoma]CUU98290.1 hypothetical transcript [Hymenolepis microstoma]
MSAVDWRPDYQNRGACLHTEWINGLAKLGVQWDYRMDTVISPVAVDRMRSFLLGQFGCCLLPFAFYSLVYLIFIHPTDCAFPSLLLSSL